MGGKSLLGSHTPLLHATVTEDCGLWHHNRTSMINSCGCQAAKVSCTTFCKCSADCKCHNPYTKMNMVMRVNYDDEDERADENGGNGDNYYINTD